MGFFKDFWYGKEKTIEIDLRPAKATFLLNDGTKHTITRNGMLDNLGSFGIFARTGEEQLEGYVSDSKRAILVDDAGQMFSTCSVTTIETEVTSKVEKVTFRDLRN